MAQDPYVYPSTRVLKNRVGITVPDEAEEMENNLSAFRLDDLKENPIKGKLDYQHLKDIHKHLFKDMYEWAGNPRTINISKRQQVLGGDSVDYPKAAEIEDQAQYDFKQLAKENNLKGLSKEDFIAGLTKHSANIWETHSLRDGNTRIIVAFMQQPSKEAGHEMTEFDSSIRDAFVLASKANNSEKLKQLITESIDGKSQEFTRAELNDYAKENLEKNTSYLESQSPKPANTSALAYWRGVVQGSTLNYSEESRDRTLKDFDTRAKDPGFLAKLEGRDEPVLQEAQKKETNEPEIEL